MARRSRSVSQNPWLIGGVLVLVAIFAIGAVYLANTGTHPYRTTAPLEVEAYLENSNSLRGNTYQVKGEVTNVLGYSATKGRLISVEIDASDEVVPMLIPRSLGNVNIQKGQKYLFLIEVTDKGILEAKELTKS